MSNEIRLRDAIVWLNGRTHPPLTAADNWVNNGRFLPGYDATPGSGSFFTVAGDDSYWAFLAGANQALTVSHHSSLGFSKTGARTVYFRGRFSNLSDANAFLVGKKNTISSAAAGWAICRNSSGEGISGYVSDGTTQHQLNGTITYATTFVAALVWSGPSSTSTLYINGTQAATSSTSISADPAAGSGVAMYVGRQGGSDTILPYGRCNAVLIFNGAHSAAQVTQITNDLNTPPVELTIGHTYFREGPDEDSIRWDPDRTEFTIDVYPGSKSQARAMRQQLLGLQRGDVIPVTWSDDRDANGFYRVRGVDMLPVATYLATWRIKAAVTLERVSHGWARPATELTVTAKSRTGSSPPTTAYALVAVPAGMQSLELGSVASNNGTQRSIAAVNLVNAVGVVGSAALSATLKYSEPPARALDAVARIEYQDPDDDNWYTIVGRQLPEPFLNPGRLRISTGAFRVIFNRSGQISMGILTPKGWEASSTLFELTSGTGTAPHNASIYVPGPLTISRNTAQEVSVRFACRDSSTGFESAAFSGATVHITARRGMHHVDILQVGDTSKVRFGPTANSAATTVGSPTHGLYQTSADSNGNRWVIATHEAAAVFNTTRGDINDETVAYGAGFNVMLGMENPDVSEFDAADDIILEWWVAVGATQRLVNQ